MDPIIVGGRIYTSLDEAIKDREPDAESFTYSRAVMATPSIPSGEDIALHVREMLSLTNPSSSHQELVWDMYIKEVTYECHKVASKLQRFADKAPTLTASPDEQEWQMTPVGDDEEE